MENAENIPPMGKHYTNPGVSSANAEDRNALCAGIDLMKLAG
jgi:hypothetical protein